MFLSELHFSSHSATDLPGTFLSCFLPWLRRERGQKILHQSWESAVLKMLLTNQRVSVSVFVTASWCIIGVCVVNT